MPTDDIVNAFMEDLKQAHVKSLAGAALVQRRAAGVPETSRLPLRAERGVADTASPSRASARLMGP